MQVKKCTKCLRVKQLDKFAKNARNKTDGCQPKCKECNRAYYLSNKERVIARVRNHYKENNDEILERRAELRKRPEAKKKKAQQDKSYYARSKSKIREKYKEWISLNRARVADYQREYRYKRNARIVSNGNNTLTRLEISKLFEQHPYCEYCGKIDTLLTIDHIVPINKGGQNCLANVTIACKSCNSSKGDKLLEEWLKTTDT